MGPPEPDPLAAALDAEVAAYGSVRPPWAFLPGVHPFEIGWRMGAGESHLMVWSVWARDRERGDVLAAIGRNMPVPADWAWWAAEAAGLVTLPEDEDYMEAVPFDTVRAKLADVGVEVVGEPET
ncbi:MAG: hypothetical protein ACLQVI_20570 [Polyangiaceae bacterium]